MSMKQYDIERFNELDLKIYIMLSEGKTTLSKISKELGISRNSLTKRLKEKYNYEPLLNGKLPINSNFFDIPNENNMYWLGMIYADGHLSDSGKFELTLKDKEHIEKFKKELRYSGKISERMINGSSYYRINFQDKNISCELKKYGVVHNKSNVEIEFPDIDFNFINHFIRGFFDGDGSICIKQKSPNVPCVSITFGLVNYHLAEIFKIILEDYNINFKIYKGRTCYSLSNSSRTEGIKFLNFIYNNSTISLDRKYLKAKMFLPS